MSFFIDIAIGIPQRLYIEPYVNLISANSPKYIMMFNRLFRHRRRMTREQKAAEELEWRRVNEEVEIKNEGVEPIVDAYFSYSCDLASVWLSPLVYSFLGVFFYDSQVSILYGLPTADTATFYWVFAFMIIPFWIAMDIFLLNAQELIHGWKLYDYVAYQRYRFDVREHRWALRSTIFDESLGPSFQTLDVMCFSSQYYFLIAFIPYGYILIVYGVSILLRNYFNPFNDPALFVVILFVLFFYLIGVAVCRYLADVKIKRFGWRGLWMTKQIEGTVDDDVAAKLAIGEGRQADLEAERLELQALNSERFRHKFLERNRPWILQHLVELLTPRSLDSIGPDGRPVIEYVRDVYAELVQMGEGKRRAGDRADISSDDEDDAEGVRRGWSREPLTGASLAIARYWLAKARKRRAFMKLVRGIIDQNIKTVCENCGRTQERNNIKLVVHLTSEGQPDPYAIDRLIALFEEQYGLNELDPQLWKAFFRGQAEYMTRCNVCDDKIEQSKLTLSSEAPGAGRLTRAEDISSDEDDDEVVFEPVVVTRSSPEGRMMSKWLGAARKKVGGLFPRPDAKRQMDNYAQKMRQLKLKKAKKKLKSGSEALAATAVNEELQEKYGRVVANAATKALARRWVQLAKESIETKFRTRSGDIQEDLGIILSQMAEEDDWYFGASLRNEGLELQKKAHDLQEDRKMMEAEAAVKVRKIEADLQDFVLEQEKMIDRNRRVFETSIAEENDKTALAVEHRQADMEREKIKQREIYDKIEKKTRDEMGAAPTELIQKHRRLIQEIDDAMQAEAARTLKTRADAELLARTTFDREEGIKKSEIDRRKIAAGESIARIRQEVAVRIRISESEWQVKSTKWLSIAKKKVAVKDSEDKAAKQSKKKRAGGK